MLAGTEKSLAGFVGYFFFFCWTLYSYSCFFRIVWVYIRMFINTPFQLLAVVLEILG